MDSHMKRLIQWYRQLKLGGKGDDVYIGKNVHITRPWLCMLGNHVALDDGFYCTTQLTAHDHCHVSAYVVVIGGEKGCLWMKGFNTIGPHSALICGSDNFRGEGLVSVTIPSQYRGGTTVGTITLEPFANLCAGVIVTPNVTIGQGAVAGAGAFVNHDLEPWTVYVGVPARPLKARPKEAMIAAARKMRDDEQGVW